MSRDLCAGRVALVTGASQGGTGTSLAIRLAAEGAAVAIVARSVEGLDECRQEIEGFGGRALVLPCDLSDPFGGRSELVARTEAELGPIDILVNNAAAGGYRPFDVFDFDDLYAMAEVNVWAPWLLMRQVVDGMRDRGEGWILNMTSASAELPEGPPYPLTAPSKAGTGYGGTKAMLNRLTVGVASEVEGQGIAVNALTPQAAILTPALVALEEQGVIPTELFEPLETMVEAAIVLCTADPDELTGRIAYSLDLLVEAGAAVYELTGDELVEGWQPEDLPARITTQAEIQSRPREKTMYTTRTNPGRES